MMFSIKIRHRFCRFLMIIEDCLKVIIFMLQNEDLPNYDDKVKTLHLNKLNV